MYFFPALMVKNSDAEWKKKLTPEQFWVCRQKGTELVWGIHAKKKKTLNKHVLREHRSGFVGDSMFPQGTGWMSLDLEWMTEITWMLSSTCCLVFWKFTHHLPLSTFPPILTKKSLFLIHGSPYTKEVTKLVFKKDLIWEEQSKICSAINSRSALVINLLFISFNYKSFFLVSLQPWSGEYLDLKTKGI